MAALPNICGALCSTPQSLADAHYYRVPCSNAAKMRNPLKFAGVPQTSEPISAVSGPKFTILRGHVEEALLLNSFFPIVDMCQLRRYSPTNVSDGAEMAIFASFFGPVFPANRMQHISDLHPKCALRPHHVPKYGKHPISDR